MARKKIYLILFVCVAVAVIATGMLAKESGSETEASSKEKITTAVTTATQTTEETTKPTTKPTTTAKPTTAAPETSAPKKLDKVNCDNIKAGQKLIAITFDDGPGKYTARLLKILEKNGALATFFVVGNRAKSNSELISKIVGGGHEVGSHTWQHSDFSKLSYADALADMKKSNDAIEKACGKRPTLVRPPYGAMGKSLSYAAVMQNQAIITWSVDPRDWDSKNADKVYNQIMSTVEKGDIILCHDIHETTVDAMERVIPALIKQGYQFVTVSQLLTYERDGLTAGKVYRER